MGGGKWRRAQQRESARRREAGRQARTKSGYIAPKLGAGAKSAIGG